MFNYQNFKIHLKKHCILVYPIMLSQLSHVSVVMSDSIMVSWLGTVPLAAAGLANSITWPFFTFGLGLSYGITPIIAAADARLNYKKVSKTLKNSLIINIIIGIFFFLIITCFSPLVYNLGQEEHVTKLAHNYILILSTSLLPFMLFQVFRQYTEGLSLTKPLMYINLTCGIVNIVLNYILIYGKYGMPAMGLNGAGLATLCSRILLVIMAVCYLFTPKLKQYITHFRYSKFSYLYIFKILKLGIPSGLEWSFGSTAFSITGIMVGWISTEAQAASVIVYNLSSASFMLVWGIGIATTIRVSNQWSMRNMYDLRREGFVGFFIGICFMFIIGIIFIVFNHSIPNFYTCDTKVLHITASLLIILGIYQIFDGVIAIGVCALRGIEDTFIPFIISVVAYWLLGLPLSYLMAFIINLGVEGIWLGLSIATFFSSLTLFIRFYIKTKRFILLKF